MSDLWELPPTWCWVAMGDATEVIGGGTPSTNNPKNFQGSIPWITPADMSGYSGKTISGGSRCISESGLDSSGARWLPKGAVLFSSRAPIGYVAIASRPVTTNQGFKSFVPASGLDSNYVYYWLTSAKQYAENMASGTTFLELSGAKAAQIPLPIAPADEQTRIVDKLEELLSDLNAGIAELKTAQAKLLRYRQSLLKAAVEGALTAEWRQHNTPEETGAQLLQRILSERRARWEAKQLAKFAEQGKAPPKDWQKKYPEPVQPSTSDLPELPEGWVWASVDQLCFVIRGASPRPAGDPRYFGGSIPWITVGSITCDDEVYLRSTEQFVTEAGKEVSRFIEVGTLLLTNSGATLGVPKIAKIGGCINDGSVALLDIDETTKLYLYWFLKTQTEKLRALNQGAAQPNLNTDIVRRISVPICAKREMLEVLKVIEETVSNAKSQENSLEIALKQSTAQRKNILRAAFSGQLVPQDPNDEPASALLARIRAQREAGDPSATTKRGRKPKGTA